MVWGMENDRVLQGTGGANCLPQWYTYMSSKSNTKKYKRLVREAVIRNSTEGAYAIKQAEVGEVVVVGSISEAQRRTLELSYSHIRYEKANLNHEGN